MIGFRVARVERRVPRSLVERFSELPVANVSDCMSRMSSFGAAMRPLHGGATVLSGTAVTVRTRPGDNLMIHEAIDIAEPGDVIVADAGGDTTNALIGELMLSHARHRGVAGFVINGAVRDLGWIKAHDFPVFAIGVNHRGPYKDGPGEVNLPIAINGAVVAPGDLILGDEDGVVVVPFDEVEALLPAVTTKHEAELKQLQAIEEGHNKREWVDEALRQRGCVID